MYRAETSLSKRYYRKTAINGGKGGHFHPHQPLLPFSG
jgi:hypothetical protein